MHKFWSFFTTKRNFSYLLLGVLIIVGAFSLISIQKESNPEVKVPIGIVSVSLPGASAADTEKLITNKIENSLSGSLKNVKKITSVSSNGSSQVTVEFDANADLKESIQELKDRVDIAKTELPEDATDPYVAQIDFSQEPVITFAVTGDLPDLEFTKIAKRLEDDLKSVSGVAGVNISGLREEEVQVIVDAESLNRYEISLADVTNAIGASNASLPIGNIQFDGVSYNLQFEADIIDPNEVENIAITSLGGAPIYVRDVAQVSNGLSELVTLSRVSLDGQPSSPGISVSVTKQAGANVTDITDTVNQRLAELEKPGELLDGLDVLIIFDTGELLRKDLSSLSQSGVMAIVLVTLVLLLTLGWREALVAGLSIPLSFMLAFAGLLLSGNTLNFISLFSLILSVGILVDSAIVVVEGIHTNMKARPQSSKVEAALKTIREFHAPVTAGTMTTIAVFVPLFFISGIVGEFIKSIPFTVISVLLASLLVALGFVPLIASVLLRRRNMSQLEVKQEHITEQALLWYKGKLSLILGHKQREDFFLALVIASFFASFVLPIKGMLAAVLYAALITATLFWLLKRNVRWLFLIPATILVLAAGGFLVNFVPSFLQMKVEFFPAGDEDYLIVEMELPEGTILQASEFEARKIEEILYQEPDIESFVMTVGSGSAFAGGSNGAKFANAFIQLKEDREHTSIELADILTESLSVIKSSDIRVTQMAGGPPVGTPVVISFYGTDMNELERLATEAARILKDIPGTNAVTTSAKNDNLEFVLTVDKDKASALGLSPSLVALTLRNAIEGSKATTINTPDGEIDVVVKLDLNPTSSDPHTTNQATLDDVRNIELRTPSGETVILDSVLTTSVEKSNQSIVHEDEKRVATAESELGEGGNTAVINQQFLERAEKELNLGEGVEMVVGGQNQETDQSFAEMGYAIIAGMILMFSIIVLMFNSFRHAVYVILPAFFSFTGIALGLTLTGKALSFPALMGLIALIGIVVNNSIILLDVMNNRRRENQDEEIMTTVLDGSASRLRPILLTTVTTVIGIVPLLFTADFWTPLALSIIFGLSYSVIITLIFIPVIYSRNPGEID